MPHDVTLLRDIALGIIFAALLGHAARLLRQPLLLGYIAGGILLSDQMGFGIVTDGDSIELISEIGLILLLFFVIPLLAIWTDALAEPLSFRRVLDSPVFWRSVRGSLLLTVAASSFSLVVGSLVALHLSRNLEFPLQLPSQFDFLPRPLGLNGGG